jgi:hypothetical protein
MLYALALAGLATMAAAAPMTMPGDNWYVSYKPYANYGSYRSAVVAETSKMTKGKTTSNNPHWHFAERSLEAAHMRRMMKPPTYDQAVEDLASKMQAGK